MGRTYRIKFVYLLRKSRENIAAYETIMNSNMTQEERWMTRYNEVLMFIETNKRNLSKHRIEEHDMLNWLKANRKVMNAGKMKPERVELFSRLLAMCEKYRHVNQYM